MTKYNWLPQALDFLEVFRVEPEMIEAVIAHPTSTGLHPKSGEVGYEIKSYRRGDLEACVSFKHPDDPAVAYVYMHLPMDDSKGSSKSGGPVKKAAAKAPNGLKEFKRWVHAAGYKPVLRNGHTHVLREDGSLLMVTSSTPGDKMAITNAWQKFLRLSAVDAVREDLGDLVEKTTPSAPEDPSTVPGMWMCPHCNDWFGPKDAEDGDVPPVCYMCKKAGR